MLGVSGKRLGRFGLQLHPTKTRFVDFRFRRPGGRHSATAGTTFNFLGFTHVWGEPKNGKHAVRQTTAKDRYACALASVTEWCRRNLHRPSREQHAHLSQVIRGTAPTTASPETAGGSGGSTTSSCGYGGNSLPRRHCNLPWPRFRAMLAQHPLRPALIIHQYTAA
jgi:hypothetical protein